MLTMPANFTGKRKKEKALKMCFNLIARIKQSTIQESAILHAVIQAYETEKAFL